jgi:metallo-beta-lactamase family protein
MDIRIKFLGATQTVTGSKFLLDIDDYRILIDCGLFQGLKHLRVRNWEVFPVDPASIQAVVLTHAHIDHTGYLPKLYKEGFAGKIYCTEATAELSDLLLRDSAKLQEEDAQFAAEKGYSKHNPPLPLYTIKEAEAVLKLFAPIPFGQIFRIHDKVQICYQEAGHILGAGILELLIEGEEMSKKIVFSGDLGRFQDPILPPPTLIEEADIVIMESTYGNRSNPFNHPEKELARIINDTFAEKGCLLIPAFAVGRTQMLLYYIKKLYRAGAVPRYPVYVDSPMAISATNLHKKYFNEETVHALGDDLFDFPELHFCNAHEMSSRLTEIKHNAIIISASGMATGGRILHHLYHRLRRENDTVLFAGYQAAGTRGRRLLDGEKEIRMYGENIPVNCRIESLDGLSAHADQGELIRWLEGFTRHPKVLFLVHGEPESSQGLQQEIRKKFHWNIVLPEYLESFELFSGI